MIRRIKPRSTPRRGQPSKEEKGRLRAEVYKRSEGRCELNLSPNCIRGVLPESGVTPWDHWHLVHLKSKRRFGWGLENLAGGCWKCHLVSLHTEGGNGKIVPKKERL